MCHQWLTRGGRRDSAAPRAGPSPPALLPGPAGAIAGCLLCSCRVRATTQGWAAAQGHLPLTSAQLLAVPGGAVLEAIEVGLGAPALHMCGSGRWLVGWLVGWGWMGHLSAEPRGCCGPSQRRAPCPTARPPTPRSGRGQLRLRKQTQAWRTHRDAALAAAKHAHCAVAQRDSVAQHAGVGHFLERLPLRLRARAQLREGKGSQTRRRGGGGRLQGACKLAGGRGRCGPAPWPGAAPTRCQARGGCGVHCARGALPSAKHSRAQPQQAACGVPALTSILCTAAEAGVSGVARSFTLPPASRETRD